MDEVFVQYKFKEKVDIKGMQVEYSDAIFYPFSDFSLVSQEEIDTTKQERIDNWKYAVENPPPEIEPTKKDLEDQVVELEKQVVDFQEKIDELNILIEEK